MSQDIFGPDPGIPPELWSEEWIAGRVEAELAKPEHQPRWSFLSAWGPDPLAETPANRDWLLTRDGSGAMAAGKVAMLAAGGGVGKTTCLCSLALSLASGRKWLGTFTTHKAGRVVLALGEEDREEVQRRLHWASRQLELTHTERKLAASRILVLPLAGEVCNLVENDEEGNIREAPFLIELRAELEDIGKHEPWRAVIIDPLSRFGGLETEIGNAPATRFVQALETLTKLPGKPAVIVAHHISKASRKEGQGDASSPRGASALVDGVRWCGTLTSVPGSGRAVIFNVVKSNYAATGERIPLIRGRSGLLRPASVEEWAEYFPDD